MRIYRKDPGSLWEPKEIPNTLEALQQEVGGYIEPVAFCTDASIICNEEGRLQGLPKQLVFGAMWYGTILLVGVDGEEFTDCPDIEEVLL